jgi:hypothetical protein
VSIIDLSKKKYFPNKQGCKDATACLVQGMERIQLRSAVSTVSCTPPHILSLSKIIAKWELCVFVKKIFDFLKPFPKQMRMYFTAIWGKSGFGSGLSKPTKSTIPDPENDYWTMFILYTYLL